VTPCWTEQQLCSPLLQADPITSEGAGHVAIIDWSAQVAAASAMTVSRADALWTLTWLDPPTAEAAALDDGGQA
jgi:hypothetical protein